MTDVPDRAGWFDDPDNAEQLRYFDGILWTSHTTPRRTLWHGPPAAGQEPASGPAPTPQPSLYAPHQGASTQSPGTYGYPSRPTHGAPGGAYGPPAVLQPDASGPATADGVPLASMGARFAAWILDSVITTLLGVLLGGYLLWRGLGNYPQIVAEAMREAVPPSDAYALAERVQFDTAWLGAFAVLQLVIGVVYHTVFLSSSGATPGRRAAGISVRLAERGGVLSWSDAMRRSLLRPVLFLFVSTPGLSLFAAPLSILDAVSALWHPQRQTLHDRLGRTVVVRGPQPKPPVARKG